MDHLIAKPRVGSKGTSSKKERNEAKDRIEIENEFLRKFERHKESHKITYKKRKILQGKRSIIKREYKNMTWNW